MRPVTILSDMYDHSQVDLAKKPLVIINKTLLEAFYSRD